MILLAFSANSQIIKIATASLFLYDLCFIETYSNYQILVMNDTTIDEKDHTDEKTIAETTPADVTTTAVLDLSVKMMIVVQDLCAETNHEAERGHIGETIDQIQGETIAQILGETIAQIPEETIAQILGETIAQILGETIAQTPEETIAQILGETIAQIIGETIDQILEETIAQILDETIAQILDETIAQILEETNGMIEAGGMNEIEEMTEGISERTMDLVGMLETGTLDRMVNRLGLKKRRIPQSE